MGVNGGGGEGAEEEVLLLRAAVSKRQLASIFSFTLLSRTMLGSALLLVKVDEQNGRRILRVAGNMMDMI